MRLVVCYTWPGSFQRLDTEMHLHTRAAVVFQVFVSTVLDYSWSSNNQLFELGLEARILNLWAS